VNLRTLLYRAAGSGDPAVVEKVAAALADSPENADRLAAATCTSDCAVLTVLANDSCRDVRDAAARNPSASFQLVSAVLQAGSAGYGSVMRKDFTEPQARALWLLVRGKFKSGTAVAYPEGLLGRPSFTRDVLGTVPYEQLPMLMSNLIGTDVEDAARDAIAFRMHAHKVSVRETPLMRLAPRRTAWLIAACAAARLGPDCLPKSGLAGSEELTWWADPFPFTADPVTVKSSYRRFDSMLDAAGRFLSGAHIDAVIASQEVSIWGWLYVSGSDSVPVRWMIDTFPSNACPAGGFSSRAVSGMSDDDLADVAALMFDQRRVSLVKPDGRRTLETVGNVGGQVLLDVPGGMGPRDR